MTDKAVKVSPRTFEALEALKEVRGSSFDRVIRDLVESFAPFMADTVYSQDNPNVSYLGDKETIVAGNKKIGARSAYAQFWRRVENTLESMTEEPSDDILRKRMAEYERLKKKGVI